MQDKSMKVLKTKLMELAHIGSTLGFLGWDEQVMMPRDATEFRARTNAYLSGLYHKKVLELNEFGLLDILHNKYDSLNDDDRVIVRETIRDYNRAKNIPTPLIEKLSQLSTEAYSVWMSAREKNDFSIFSPILERIVDLKIEEANHIGYKESPYDALLDEFERDTTTKDLTRLFEELKQFLVPFVKNISESEATTRPLKGEFSINQQQNFSRILAEKIGFNFASGRLDTSTHPFTSGTNPKDVRITTRYDKEDLMQSVMSTIHETGHALYEQGLQAKHFGTPLGESVSFGIHESQSMFWEKRIGGSKAFWKFFYPQLKSHFKETFSGLSLEQFYKSINIIEPSLIRTEADEATYCLHIIIRFELERDLIEQKIRVNDLKKLWNEKMKNYLGIEVPDDVRGVLQDVHWAGGAFGYFPSYALGNLYSAQIYATARKKISNFDELVSKGDFEPILAWLRENIFSMGKRYTPAELIKKVTGEQLNPQLFFNYLKEKYEVIYK